MNDCSICGSNAAWRFDARGVSGVILYCASCLPRHLRPLIGNQITPVVAEPVLPRGDDPVVPEVAQKAPRKRASRAKQQP